MQAYMVELYQDTLVDLLLPKSARRLKLEIKKDSKVMRYIFKWFLDTSLISCVNYYLRVWSS